ncbi:odorant receptor 4 [Manduca sexta]|uniref:Odorant receptor n=1 Tax=Manduca sexta TaxID=7130 RepID=A0A5K8B1C8_MANSE|nr:odorant receptor 4 [Manduca sexta]CUQ99290.1 TPA: Olfactory receptor 43 [Manduca sexta]
MLERLSKYLENPNHPLLGPTLYGLKCWGMWQPLGVNRIIYNAIHFFAILFVISQYVELWFIRSNMELAIRNLSVTMLSTVCVIKAGTFVFWQKSWNDVIDYVSGLENIQLSKRDRITNSVISEYTKYSRSITYSYWVLVTATVFTVILAPLVGFLSSSDKDLMLNGTLAYPEIMSSWLPFNRSRGFGYWVAAIEHSLICFYGGGVVANYDSNAIVLMSFFAGQLKLLSINCARLFNDNEVLKYSDTMKRIKDCHHHHVEIVKFSMVLNSLLSPVMFLYVIICSLMICASAIQLTAEGTSNMQRIWISEYLMALIAQLFIYCWHSNEVLHMSSKVDEGVYASHWSAQNVRVRRSVVLLGGQLRRPIVFTAGPFTKLTISTFVAILKGSYSYYTLLSKKED